MKRRSPFPNRKSYLPSPALATLLSLLAASFHASSQPVIVDPPQSTTNVVGTTVSFSVFATGTSPLSYQWQYFGVFLNNETNAVLSLTNVQTSNAGAYAVIVTNVEGSVTSAVATLTVWVPPAVTAVPTYPTNQSTSLGANVTFGFSTQGTTPLYYRWQRDGLDLPGRTSRLLTLTNIQTADAGAYTLLVTNVAGSASSPVATLSVDPAFTKITTGNIVTDVGTGTGCAWGEYDGDGRLDLIVTSAINPQTGLPQKNVLFHNNGNGTFTKVTNTVATAEARDWRGCAWIDYDNDGLLDLFVTSTDANGVASQNELFRNNGDGTFTKMAATDVGALVPGGGGSEGPAWADYDCDGFLDAYVVRYGNDWLFHNNGDGTFTQIPNTNGIPTDNYITYRAMWADYNADGWPDLFVPVVSDIGLTPDRLYLGLGNGSFTNTATNALIGSLTNRGSTSSGVWADYDNDGYPDLFLVRVLGSAMTNTLYHNNGDGTFTRMTSSSVGPIVSDVADFGPECAWGDYDNDGFLDLFVTSWGSAAHNYLYHNNGDGSFSRIDTGSLVNDLCFYPVSCAWGDYDNNGFLDLFVACGSDAGPTTNLLYRNNGNSNGWLKVKLIGVASNRSAIGAKVRVQASIRGRAMWQLREINTGDGFSAGPLEAHFGLGDATNIDQVRIEWPSGIVQVLTNVAARQSLTISEHQDTPVLPTQPHLAIVSLSTNGVANLSAAGEAGLLYVFEASTNLANWTKVGVVSNATGLISFADARATNYTRRFYRVSIP